MPNNQREKKISIELAKYINLQYPDVIFFPDASGVRLTMGQAIQLRAQRCNRYKIPDFFILEPKGYYHGLILELKREDEIIFLKDGSLSKNKHIQEQHKSLIKLQSVGYFALFSVGLDSAIRIVDRYMNL
jgi:hypothetical protein